VTFTAVVTAAAPGGGIPSGVVAFFDATTHTDLGSAILVNGTASLSASFSVAGTHTITATYGGDDNFLSDAGTSGLAVLEPARLSGLVFEDLNGDGEVNVGEAGIAGVSLHLGGTDDLGHVV